jgi:hypothetical protein
MQLVNSRIAHADTIVNDDGVIIGVIYYQAVPIDDSMKAPKEIFRDWFMKMKMLEEKAALETEDNHLTMEDKE